MRGVVFASLVLCALAQAGEIVILQPLSGETGNEKNLDRTVDRARQRAGKQAAPLVVEDAVLDRGSNAERSSREAREYSLRQAPPQNSGEEGTTVILRSAPISDAEKARQKAVSFVPPGASSLPSRACGDVSLSIGTIGDKAVTERSANVNERGNSAVNVNCRK